MVQLINRTYETALVEFVCSIATLNIILIALYFFGVTDIWTLLLISAAWWGIMGVIALHRCSKVSGKWKKTT